MAWFSGVVLAQDIGTPDRVSMGNEPASRAAIDAPLRFMPLHATRTGLAIRQIETNKHTCVRIGFSQ